MKDSSGLEFAYASGRTSGIGAKKKARSSEGDGYSRGDLRGNYSGFVEPRGRATNHLTGRGAGRCLGRNAVPVLRQQAGSAVCRVRRSSKPGRGGGGVGL